MVEKHDARRMAAVAMEKDTEKTPKVEMDGIRSKDHIERILEHLKTLESQPKTLHEANEEVVKFLRDLDPQTREIVERKMADIDFITKVPKRDAQNDLIKREIFKRKDTDGSIKETNTLGIISYDLRGLKVVNDSSNDHEIGDKYLRRLADNSKEVHKELRSVLKGLEMNVARDGGDEFSIIISSKNINLDQNLNSADIPKELQALVNNELVQQIIKDAKFEREMHEDMEVEMEEPEKEVRLIEVLTEYLSRKLGEKKHDDLFLDAQEMKQYKALMKDGKNTEAEQLAREKMHETINRHVNKGAESEDEIVNAPKEYSLHSFVAAGGATLSEIINNPEVEDFKKLGKLENGESALSQLVGAMRSRSDKRAYDAKADQNRDLIFSKDPEKKFRMLLATRNEFTASMGREIIKLAEQLDECERKLKK